LEGQPPCGARPGDEAAGLVFNLYRVAEVHSVEHDPLLVFNVDTVMEHYATIIFGGFSKRHAGGSHGMCSRSLQIG
jgi:hypothetical protein